MIRSMTGFGRASGPLSPRYSVTVTAKSVNHRFLEVSVRLPEYCWDSESAIRARAAELFSRGKLDISVRVQRTAEPEYSVRVNSRMGNAVIPQLRQLMDEQGMAHTLTGSDLLRVPDLIQVEAIDSELDEGEREKLLAIITEGLNRVLEMRSAEGRALSEDVVARVDAIEKGRSELEAQRELFSREALDNYRQKIEELGKGSGIVIDADRLAQEALILVERSDIAEELTRLAIHIDEVRKVISGPQAAGKKLDFLSQEMLREVNTVGSKSRSSTVRRVVVELKTEIERTREQVQNVE